MAKKKIDLEKLRDKYDEEYLEFDKIENKRSSRPDIHAFILLNELFPEARDMVCWAEHDEIGLDVDEDDLEKKATEEQILELIRCGVRFGDGMPKMFV
jgi:hypothetical protein